jgi:hypothetical protein
MYWLALRNRRKSLLLFRREGVFCCARSRRAGKADADLVLIAPHDFAAAKDIAAL